jgi:hypothetical protein
MQSNRKSILPLLFFIMLFINKNFSQVSVKASYIFTRDSVDGFDESAASAGALSNGCFGDEFKVFLYNQKRIYIKRKYNLKTASQNNKTLYQNANSYKTSLTPGGSCNNEDFELVTSQIVAPSAVQGWTMQSGTNNGSCVFPTITGNNNFTVFSVPTNDPKIPGQISSYFNTQNSTTPSGNSFIKLGNNTSGGKVNLLSKSFIVDANNSLFQYAYLPVIQDGAHTCCDQPGLTMSVTITNTVTNTSTVLACPTISISVPNMGCSFTIPVGGPVFVPAIGGGSWYYSDWVASAFDLSPYLNYQVQIDVMVLDCTYGGHGAYAYFDAKCSSMVMSSNNSNNVSANNQSITLSSCGSNSYSITAPPGLGPYTWSGLNVLAPYNSPLMTNQVFTTNVAGIYTLSMNPMGSCFPIIKIITLSILPSPTLSVIGVTNLCIGTSSTFTLSGANSYSLNSVACTNTINILPLPNSTAIISGNNSLGCISSQSLSVSVNTTCADVWPGDANSDGVCNNLDVLELGMHYLQTGPSRANTSNLWQSYFANNWIGIISNGKNLNHSDCNGDGLINQNDLLAIFNNYNLTHAFKNTEENSIDPQLNIIPDQSFVNSGGWGSVSIYLGDSIVPATLINGLAFTVNFDKTYIEQDSVYLDYPTSFLNVNGNNLHFKKNQFNSGFVYAATTHTNTFSSYGYGKVATFYFKVNPNLSFDTLFHLSLSLAYNSNLIGNISSLTVGSESVVAIGNTVGLKENTISNFISIFPNPTNGIVTIKSDVEMQKIEVLNSAGQILLVDLTKNKTHQLHLGSLARGIYFMKIYSLNGSVNVKKIVTTD